MSRAASPSRRRSHAAEDRPLAQRVGARLRKARLEAGMTQAQLAAGRYTKAYVSALENGLVQAVDGGPQLLRRASPVADGALPFRWRARMDPSRSGPAPCLRRLGGGDRRVSPRSSTRDPPIGPAPSCFSVWRRHSLVSIAGRRRSAPRPRRRRSFRAHHRATEAALATYWEAYGLYEMEQGDQAGRVLRQLLDGIAAGVAVEPDFHVRVLIALSMVTSRDDEPERALAYLERARAMVGELDDRKRAVFLFSLAISYNEPWRLRSGDHDRDAEPRPLPRGRGGRRGGVARERAGARPSRDRQPEGRQAARGGRARPLRRDRRPALARARDRDGEPDRARRRQGLGRGASRARALEMADEAGDRKAAIASA